MNGFLFIYFLKSFLKKGPGSAGFAWFEIPHPFPKRELQARWEEKRVGLKTVSSQISNMESDFLIQ